MSNVINEIEARHKREDALGAFQVGDTVDVHVQIREGEKERVQIFTGTVIKIQGGNSIRATFTVRRIVAGEGVERTFPFHSPIVLSKSGVRVRSAAPSSSICVIGSVRPLASRNAVEMILVSPRRRLLSSHRRKRSSMSLLMSLPMNPRLPRARNPPRVSELFPVGFEWESFRRERDNI